MRDVPRLQRALLAWYQRERRALPWRDTRDPYRVWVSEIMLQQTQVATATPYYVRFVERFPDVRALAEARREDVLATWSGLGYYRRARMLHEAAGVVVREHAGRIPSDPAAFTALPGVGRYTAGAVLSIGFGRSLPVLDGNVARVLSRLTGRPLAIKRPADAKVLWAMAEAIMVPAKTAPPRRGARVAAGRPGPRARAASRTPGHWNQALMELGAMVCTPRSPRCGACPVRSHCVALATGQQESLPPAAERRAVVAVRRAMAVVWCGDRLLVAKRKGTHLDGLWEPPGLELARGDEAATRLGEVVRALGVGVTLRATRTTLTHTITHHAIRVNVFVGKLRGARPRASTARRWVGADDRKLALTALARRVLTSGPPAAPSRASRSPSRGRSG